MEFRRFERLALRALFESSSALTAAQIAYLTGCSVAVTERHLARMAETGAVLLRAGRSGEIEYWSPRPDWLPPRQSAAPPTGSEASPFALLARPTPSPTDDVESPLAAVLLSVVVPGAGHVYAGRPVAGVAWMASTLVGYACCLVPGLFLHGLCLVSAASARRADGLAP